MKKFFSAILAVSMVFTATQSLTEAQAQGEGASAGVSAKSKSDLVNLPFNAAMHSENYVDVDGAKGLDPEDKAALDQKGQDKFWAEYSNLDNMGRGQDVKALVTYNKVLTRSSAYMKEHGILYDNKKIFKRPGFPTYVHVSGEYKDGVFDKAKQRWKGQDSNNAQVTFSNGSKGYFYNKSHTLAWSLGGDMETHNVTLGTRAQNVGTGKGGMIYAENTVRDAVNKNEATKVYYHVTPMYKGSELVPRGSHVRAYSVNDGGKSVNLNIWVFNTQDGFLVDYMTGAFDAA